MTHIRLILLSVLLAVSAVVVGCHEERPDAPASLMNPNPATQEEAELQKAFVLFNEAHVEFESHFVLSSDIDLQKDQLKQGLDEARSILTGYNELAARTSDDGLKIHAAVRMADLYRTLGDRIATAPIPSHLNEDQSLMYEDILFEHADTLYTQARKLYTEAVNHADKRGLSHEIVEHARAQML